MTTSRAHFDAFVLGFLTIFALFSVNFCFDAEVVNENKTSTTIKQAKNKFELFSPEVVQTKIK